MKRIYVYITISFLSLLLKGESWGHASTIRIVLYWENKQRYMYNIELKKIEMKKNKTLKLKNIVLIGFLFV
jgi:hypothetical protein